VELPTVENVGSLWPRLLEFAEVPEHRDMLEEAGLILGPLDVLHIYQATPTNTVTFASTGVSGVHFGFLVMPNAPLDSSPVVMTVPLAAEPNHVIAGTLHEFLCLGCRQGWAFLEQFAHDPEWALSWYQATEPSVFPLGDPMARLLRLTPWPNVRARLAELREYHLGRLAIRPPEPEPEPEAEPVREAGPARQNEAAREQKPALDRNRSPRLPRFDQPPRPGRRPSPVAGEGLRGAGADR